MDFYEMLRIPRSADDAEIHNAYLRRKTELETGNAPELSPEEVRKQLSDIEYARKVLSDPVQRAEYDRALAADETLNRTAPRPVYKVSLAKPQLKKEQEFIPPATPPQAQSVPEIPRSLPQQIPELLKQQPDILSLTRQHSPCLS